MKRIAHGFLLYCLGLLIVFPVHAEIDTEAADIYGRDELATERKVLVETLKRSRNPVLQAKRESELLHGPLDLKIRVVDAQTSAPIPQYVLHAFYVVRGRTIRELSYHERPGREAAILRYTHELPICRYESQVIDQPEGLAVYHGVPAGQYWIQVLAAGHVETEFSQRIVVGQTEITLAVQRQAGLKVRLVDSLTSQPLGGLELKLEFPYEHEARHSADWQTPTYRAKTDADGRAEWSGLPADDYTLTFFDSMQITKSRLEELIKVEPLGVGSEARRRAGSQRKPLGNLVNDYLELQHPVSITDLQDLGTIGLQRTPVVRVVLRDAAGLPLAGFPFELGVQTTIMRGITGEDGTTSMSLPFPVGQSVTLFAPWRPALASSKSVKAAQGTTTTQGFNQVTGKLKAGPPLLLELRYQPSPDDLSLRIAFIDKTTSAPLQQVRGLIGEPNGVQPRRFWAPAGETQLDHIKLSVSMLETEQRVLEADRKDDRSGSLNYERRHLNLIVDATAPGYTPQTFYLPLTEVRAGTLAPLAMEPAVNAHGRVMLAPGVPFTREALSALYQQAGKTDPELKDLIARNAPGATGRGINFLNNTLEGGYDPMQEPHFMNFQHVRMDEAGYFVTSDLRAGERWELRLEVEGFPPIFRGGLTLLPGDNDFGEIYLSQRQGSVTLSVVDESGAAVEGARLVFPMEQISFNGYVTDADGQISVSLAEVKSPVDQLLHLAPPWGLSEESGQGLSMRIIWARETALPKQEDNKVSATLSRGHTLTVRYHPNAASAGWSRFYADPMQWRNVEQNPHERYVPYVGLGGAALQQIGLPREAWRYHQSIVINGGLSLTSGTQQFEIRDVPAGRFALRVDGGLYMPLLGQTRPTEAQTTQPIAYLEFEMPKTDHAVDFAFNGAEVELVLDAPPPVPDGDYGVWGSDILVDRNEPVSSLQGSELRSLMAGMSLATIKPMDQFRRPMLGYAGFMLKFDPNGAAAPRTLRLLCIPAGHYTIQAYSSMFGMINSPGKPDWEQKIEVKAGDEKQTLHWRP